MISRKGFSSAILTFCCLLVTFSIILLIQTRPALSARTFRTMHGQIPVESGHEKSGKESTLTIPTSKDHCSPTSASSDIHSQATAYAKLGESTSLNSGSINNEVLSELTDESGLTILPVSAESAGLLPHRKDHVKGSDLVLEAVLEAEVAQNVKDFFSQPENQIKCE